MTLSPLQTSLDFAAPRPRIPGVDPAESRRLVGQMRRVYEVMSDGQWRALHEIAAETMRRFDVTDSEAGVSARLRCLRRAEFGAHTVDRRRRDGAAGLWEYRLEVRR